MDLLITFSVLFLIGFAGWLFEIFKDKQQAEEELNRLLKDVQHFYRNMEAIEEQLRLLDYKESKIKKERADIDELVKQRSKGFPLLGEVYENYFNMKAKIVSDKLKFKKRPAYKAAEAIKESNKEKRSLAKKLKVMEYKIKNYELIAPFLTEIEEELPTEKDAWILRDYSEEEREDEATLYLTKEEYRKLSVTERNQLALDRYWNLKKRSKWAIGKMYEHYVGYVYEEKGWDVDYYGIDKRLDDLGRDLIATKDNLCHIIQCKNWSRFKKIYENHIFQLFGTAFEYQRKRPSLEVVPVFYTSTNLSETALEMSHRLDIEVIQGFKMKQYPAIKCNVNKANNTKIYHLPFDQQYDKTKIDKKNGDFYCMTVKEAEDKGFRRAFRWRGDKTKA